jgi:hypothetical protein
VDSRWHRTRFAEQTTSINKLEAVRDAKNNVPDPTLTVRSIMLESSVSESGFE